jgi:hypothetical protein
MSETMSPVGDLLTTEEVSRYLSERWRLKRGPRRLAELRAAGTGPEYHRTMGNRGVIYSRRAVDRWAVGVLGVAVASTAEETVLGRLSPKLRAKRP